MGGKTGPIGSLVQGFWVVSSQEGPFLRLKDGRRRI